MPNKYPTLTPTERAAMVKAGWLYNPQADIWMFAPNDIPFSKDQRDHDFAFAEDLAKLEAEEAHALNYATAGTAPYKTD
jgi:hypothetical protein